MSVPLWTLRPLHCIILDTLPDPGMIARFMQDKRGLQLDRVVLLGRTFEEYRQYFLLEPADLIGMKVLDVAGGVSSFCAEANNRGIKVTAFDPIYSLPMEQIREQSESDLESVYRSIGRVPTYCWGFYKNPITCASCANARVRYFFRGLQCSSGALQGGGIAAIAFPRQRI